MDAYATVVQRVAVETEGGATVYVDEGTAVFTPVLSEVRLGDTTPPLTERIEPREATFASDGSGISAELPDLGSEEINPRLARTVAAWRVTYRGLKADGQDLALTSFSFHPLPADELPLGETTNDLTLLAPLPTGPGTAIVQGKPGVGVADLAIEAGDLVVTLDDATEVNAGALPLGPTGPPGGSDAAQAAWINDLDSETRAALNQAFAGRDVPGRDLWLIWWQSRASGRGLPFTSNTDPSDGRVLQYGATGSESRQWILATEPLLQHDIASGVGPGLTFGRGYASVAPVGRLPGLVGCAHGSTGFRGDPPTEEFTWLPGRTDLTNLGPVLVDLAKDALAAAGPGARIVGAIGLGGEDDAAVGVTQAGHMADLADFKDFLCTELDAPDLLFVLGQMQPTNIASSAAIATIDAAQQAFAASDPNVLFVHGLPGAHNTGDIVHDNAVGARFLGHGALDEVAAKLWGAPQPVAPVQVTGFAASTAVASTAATVTWDKIDDALGYYVEYRTSPGGTWTEGVATTALRGTIDHLTPNTAYDFRVRAGNSAGLGPWSSTITVSTPNPILVLNDTFSRVAAAGALGNADTGQTWVDPAGKFAASGTAAYHSPTTAVAGTYATINHGTSGYRETAFYNSAIATAGSALWRWRFRVVDDTNFWFVQHRRATGKYQLYRMVNGQTTQIGPDFAAVPAATDIITVVEQADGSFQVFVNGTFQVESDDDKFATATKIGMGHGGAVTSADVPRLDRVTVYV